MAAVTMSTHKFKISVLFSLAISVFILFQSASGVTIPARFDGFVYKQKKQTTEESSIVMEAFFDPMCPYSRDSWPPLKKALQHYGSLVKLTVHPFPLPYHDNAFLTSRALHIVNNLNSSATYHMLELFFKNQEKLYNAPTHNMSRATVVKHVSNLVAKAVGNFYLSAIESGFNDTKTDHATRTSFKYGCSRGVFGTPFFFVNGFALPDADPALDYKGWRSLIDPLVSTQSKGKENALHFFL